MPKGYKVPQTRRATMKAGKAKDKSLMQQSPKTSPKIPELRPSWKRNQKSWSGFKPGSY